jgi:amylosucrase
MELVDTGNPHLFAYIRDGEDQRLLIINNFSEYPQVMNNGKLEASGMTSDAREIFTQRTIPAGEDLEIDAYRYMWIDISGQ